MFSNPSLISASASGSASVRPQTSGSGGWLGGLSTSPSTRTYTDQQRKRPSREMTLPNLTSSREGSLNEVPVGAAAPRVGVLGWFGTPSINSGTGGAVGDRDEPKPKPRDEEVTSEPECAVSEKEVLLLAREQQVEGREKELEERKVVIDQREKEVGDRSQELEDKERAMKGEFEERERVVKEGEVQIQRKTEEVERREKELEERRREFEEERDKWLEEKNKLPEAEPEWRVAMDALKKEMDLELTVERKKAEERELELETRVMKKVTEILAMDKDEQKGRKKRWDVINPLTRKATSSTLSD